MEKKPLPTWAVVASFTVVLGFVVALFAKGANGGDASREELMRIRNNQRSFASASTPGASAANRDGTPLGGPGAPPGAIVDPAAR
jgi:hypothetical protein